VSEEPDRLQQELVAPVKAEAAAQPVADNEQSPIGLGHSYTKGELVIGLVGPVGTEFEEVVKILNAWLTTARYEVKEIRVSSDIIAKLIQRAETPSGEFERIKWGMEDGDSARRESGDNSILALGAASRIAQLREADEKGNSVPAPRRAYIINSLKNPEEVFRLREIYPLGFYIFGIHSDENYRKRVLTEVRAKPMSSDEAKVLIARDEDEHLKHGQRVTDTFHLSDFFMRLVDDNQRVRNEFSRLLQILFGHPYNTPTFDEYAMFLAFASSLRSADMSRQVGAVIAKDGEIISTGANDCPSFGGGLYWPEYNKDKDVKRIEDKPSGRDYKHGRDLNKAEQEKIINQILERAAEKKIDISKLREVLQGSRITELTEFGRAVHAEMEALLACARQGVSTKGATLYCTTFPCHNCAKHIIAAGIHRVVFIEPYEKSKAEDLHGDAMKVGFADEESGVQDKLLFEPFVGVGPRRFLDLFSMRIGSGYVLSREDEMSKTKTWHPEEDANLRIQMLPLSYLDTEVEASIMFDQKRRKLREKDNGTRGQNSVGS
jgi:deoxycytidylate deaminase